MFILKQLIINYYLITYIIIYRTIWILKKFKCLTSLQDRQRLQSGQAIS